MCVNALVNLSARVCLLNTIQNIFPSQTLFKTKNPNAMLKKVHVVAKTLSCILLLELLQNQNSDHFDWSIFDVQRLR